MFIIYLVWRVIVCCAFFVLHICEGGGACGGNICVCSGERVVIIYVCTVARVCVPPHI